MNRFLINRFTANCSKKPALQPALVLVGLAVACSALPTMAAPAKNATVVTEKYFGREPWPAQRVVLLMPLQFGPGWNVDKGRGALILPEAEQKLQQAMQRSGKFSTTQLHRYNPIFLRGVQEKLVTKEQVAAVLAAPSVAGIQEMMSKMNFDQPPLIAEFAMEEITTEAGAPIPNVRAQVTGKLYEANNPEALKTVVVTSDPRPLYYQRKDGKKTVYVRRSPSERILNAANDAFSQIIAEFVKPMDDITLPEPVAPPVVTGTVMPGSVVPGTAVGTSAQTVITVPKGQVLGTFSAPKK